MKKKTLKKVTVLFMTILIIFAISNAFEVFATNPVDAFRNGTSGNADGVVGVSEASGLIGAALRIARIVGVSVAIIILSVMGTKYMVAAPGEKAEIKKHLIPYVIGAVVMLTASVIVGILESFVTSGVNIA